MYYVYVHFDPVTNETVYVGKGTGGRAWDVTRSRAGNVDHQEWMRELMKGGFVPSDWVLVIHKGLEEADAFRLEKEHLHKIGGTQFNRQSGEKNYQAKLTNAQAREIYISCYQKRRTHSDLALEYGVSRSAISMIASRKQWRSATACLK